MKLFFFLVYFLSGAGFLIASAQPGERWDFSGGHWLMSDNIQVITTLEIGKSFQVRYELTLARCTNTGGNCPVPTSGVIGYYKDNENQLTFVVNQTDISPDVKNMKSGQKQWFTATYHGDPTQIQPRRYLMQIFLQKDQSTEPVVEVKSMGFHTWNTGESNEDEPEAGELDNQAIKDLLVNYFMATEEAVKTGNLSHLERYAAKEALKVEKEIAQDRIKYSKRRGITTVSFWFKVHSLQKIPDHDRPGQDTFRVKFYRDREITRIYKGGREETEPSTYGSHGATLERLIDSNGKKVWKVTEMLSWEGPLIEHDLPTITTEEIKKNDKTIVYPDWEYEIGNPKPEKNLKKYIDSHWGPTPDNYNKAFHFYEDGDCANWGSQILIKGGRPQHILNNTQPQKQLENWYYNAKEAIGYRAPNYQETKESHTFIRANSLYQHLNQYEKSCTCRSDEEFGQTLNTGDLIFVDYKPNFIFLKGLKDHTYVVYDNLDGDVRVSSHTWNRHKDNFFIDIKPNIERSYSKNYKVRWRYCKFDNKKEQLEPEKQYPSEDLPDNMFKNILYQGFRPLRKFSGSNRNKLYIADTEITQAQWEYVMGYNNAYPKHPHYPISSVSWNEVQKFIKKLEEMEGGKYKYRLPTKEEWLYAARAGADTDYHFGNSASNLKNYAWYRDNSGNHPQIVGQLKPNAFGLYDVHGNVSEWVMDEGFYSDHRKTMNCSYFHSETDCRFSYESSRKVDSQISEVGFRLVLMPASVTDDGDESEIPSQPVFSPSAGVYKDPVTVSIDYNNSSGEVVYYTLNGSNPYPDGFLYRNPLKLNTTTTIKAVRVVGNNVSDISIGQYTVNPWWYSGQNIPMPTFEKINETTYRITNAPTTVSDMVLAYLIIDQSPYGEGPILERIDGEDIENDRNYTPPAPSYLSYPSSWTITISFNPRYSYCLSPNGYKFTKTIKSVSFWFQNNPYKTGPSFGENLLLMGIESGVGGMNCYK